MRIIDSHFHHWPRAFLDRLCERQGYPRAERNDRGGYIYWRKEGKEPAFNVGPVRFELDQMLERMDKLGHQVDVISSIGPISPHFSDVALDVGRDDAMLWNEEMAAAQRKYPGRFWGSAAVPGILPPRWRCSTRSACGKKTSRRFSTITPAASSASRIPCRPRRWWPEPSWRKK